MLGALTISDDSCILSLWYGWSTVGCLILSIPEISLDVVKFVFWDAIKFWRRITLGVLIGDFIRLMPFENLRNESACCLIVYLYNDEVISSSIPSIQHMI